jgi:hypothetical protein
MQSLRRFVSAGDSAEIWADEDRFQFKSRQRLLFCN